MKTIKPYPEYKNSELDWLGDIPSHWNEMKINHFTKVVSRKNHPKEELLSVYRDYGVILKSSRDDNNNKAGEDLSTYKLVEPGNLVLNKMKTWQGSLGISKNRGIVSPAYITCELKEELFDNRFLHYLLRSERYIYEYNRLSYGVRTDQWDMRYNDFKNTSVFVPPKPEQTAIANFLDSKTAEIQAFIALKEKTIELLKERKTAIINQAVTKGLDPNVEMKDSGIEWLGEIPKHWKVRPIKYFLKERVQRSRTGDGTLLMISQIHGLVERAKYHEKAEAAETTEGHKECFLDDLVFNKLKAHLGVFFQKHL